VHFLCRCRVLPPPPCFFFGGFAVLRSTAARYLAYAVLLGWVGTPRPPEVHLQRVVPTRAVHCIMKRNAETAKQRTITLVPASEPMPLEAFKTALLKRRCVAQRRETSTLRKALTRRALSIVLAKQKAVQLAEEAIANPPPAPAPDSAEAVAAAAAAAEHAARVQEVTRLNKAQEESYRAALQAWEQETASARRAERERLVSAMTSRRAARATEQAGIEEKLKTLQASNVTLMRQLKLVLTQEEEQKRRAVEDGEVLMSPSARPQTGAGSVSAARLPSAWGRGSGPSGMGGRGPGGGGHRQSLGPPGGYSQGGMRPQQLMPPQMRGGRGQYGFGDMGSPPSLGGRGGRGRGPYGSLNGRR